MIFPWQMNQWQQLRQAKQENRLPHALLFAGIAGTGKAQFANHFAQAMLCQNAHLTEFYCDDCHSCRLMAGRSHPNMLWLGPEKEGHAIKIDQVREVSEFVNQTSLRGGYRIVIIDQANYMNANAANALLKTLEEPPSDAIIILITDQIERLPATIRSRCQRMIFPRPQREQALAWLKEHSKDPELLLRLANGAPLAALKLAQNDDMRKGLIQTLCALISKQADPVKAAEPFQDDPLKFLDFMLAWIMDLLRLQLGADTEAIINRDYANELIALKQQTSSGKNVRLMNSIHQLRAQICSGLNLNKQLLVESVLIKWSGCA